MNKILTQEEWGQCYRFTEKECDRINGELNLFLQQNPEWRASLELHNYLPLIELIFWLEPKNRPHRGIMTKMVAGKIIGCVRLKVDEMSGPAEFVAKAMGKLMVKRIKAGDGNITLHYELRPDHTTFISTPLEAFISRLENG